MKEILVHEGNGIKIIGMFFIENKVANVPDHNLALHFKFPSICEQ